MWSTLAPETREAVLAMLEAKTRVLALQAFLIRHALAYQAVATELLVGMFGLGENAIRSEVNVLIVQGLLDAAWNEDASMLLFAEALPSRVETLSLQLLKKVEELAEANERVKEELRGEKRDDTRMNRGRRVVGVFGQRGTMMRSKGRTGK